MWGSTRISDRWLNLDFGAAEEPNTAITRELAKVVLGLRDALLSAHYRAYLDIIDDLASAAQPEELGNARTTELPEASVAVRAAFTAYDDCATYFTCFRDSRRNILIDIEKAMEQRQIIHSEAFWRNVILKAVGSKKTETQLWDFKETLTLWHAKGDPAQLAARVTLAEDVASLANARGGVLVIGVRDRTREIVGLGDAKYVEDRLKIAREVIAKHIEYDRELVSFRQVIVPSKDGKKLCLVIVVAQACGAVGSHDGQGHYTYPVRRETGIARVSQSELSHVKVHMNSDNHDFVKELNQFILDN